MHPLLWARYETIFVVWGAAIALGIGLSLLLAQRDGFGVGRAAAALGLIVVTFLAGAKLHFWLANLARLHNLGLRANLWYGFHLPGGILACALLLPIELRLLRLPALAFLDAIAPAAGFAIAIARLGCFANGCCFGYVSHQPWALAFPPGSRAFEHHVRAGLIAPDAPSSQPVLPLMLFFAAAGLVIGITLLWWRGQRRFTGELVLALTAMWATANVVIEWWRDPTMVPGSPHLWAISAAIGAGAVLLFLLRRSRGEARRPVPLRHRQ